MKTKNLPMMRTISVMVCVLWCINIMAQDSIPFFSCAQIQKDNEALTTIKKKYKGSKKKWGAAIQEYHPLENGNIQYTYIVEATDNFNIKTMMNNTQAWFGYITSSELASVKNVDDENHIIEATTGFDNVAEVCADHLCKGYLVGITGRLQRRTYDTAEGERRYVTENRGYSHCRSISCKSEWKT